VRILAQSGARKCRLLQCPTYKRGAGLLCGEFGSGIWYANAGTHRYEKEFDGVQDVFELQRNLNNAFAYDLVPSPSVIIAALKAARRVNDYPTAVRVFEGKYSADSAIL
jgi:cytochrome c oxidase subunit 5a